MERRESFLLWILTRIIFIHNFNSYLTFILLIKTQSVNMLRNMVCQSDSQSVNLIKNYSKDRFYFCMNLHHSIARKIMLTFKKKSRIKCLYPLLGFLTYSPLQFIGIVCIQSSILLIICPKLHS